MRWWSLGLLEHGAYRLIHPPVGRIPYGRNFDPAVENGTKPRDAGAAIDGLVGESYHNSNIIPLLQPALCTIFAPSLRNDSRESTQIATPTPQSGL